MKKTVLIAVSLLTVAGCTREHLVRVATSDDPQATTRQLLEQRKHAYRNNPVLLVQDARRVRRDFRRLLAALQGNVEKRWGADETVIASQRRYVKYTQNYKSRAVVDFDTGAIRVETVARENPGRHLRNAIVTTLLTPDDPRSVDLYSDHAVRLSGTPYLYGLVRDHRGRLVRSPDAAEAYAAFLLEERRGTRRSEGRTVTYVRFRMVADHVDRRAKRYAPLVERYAAIHNVSENLVFAIIKTESNFNPFAVSAAPAYGLMQLVPSSGGRDAYRAVNGRDGIPSRSYLFDPRNNIELGTAYLGLVNHRYLRGIRHPVAREYCTIAAYNGGSGAVLSAFAPDRRHAIATINSMSPSEVYDTLRNQLKNRETRRYLHKVVRARREFVRI